MHVSCFDRCIQGCVNSVKDVLYNVPYRSKSLSALFKVLALIFYGIVFCREKAYKNRWLPSQTLGCLTIVVGNLTVGGTGKTPIVEKLSRELNRQGRKVAILSRGYKSKKESLWVRGLHWLLHGEARPPRVVSDGQQCLMAYEQAGDEPLLLARNLSNVCVVVDKDRVNAGRYAIKNLQCDTLVLDDGFQYFQLKNTFCILLIDVTNPFGNGWVLPRGILREPVNRMKRAQFIFLTKSDQISTERLQSLKRLIRSYNATAPILPCIHAPKYLRQVNGDEQLTLDSLQNRRVAALSGIASPDAFEQFLKDRGATVVHTQRFVDHHCYSPKELQDFFEQAQRMGAEWVITTEKDAVRIANTEHLPLPFYFLRMEIEWIEGTAPFQRIMETLSAQHIA